ncbi:toprim domain-containing protein, partial [Actinosynnema sp.]|uniref:toprim domain-containing protein n=1 Tax=Actinosynnema sp. TaxID=1872144 RepID=UPI003F87B471
ELSTAGLVSSGQRGVYDRFRGRLVWPIRDVSGQTIGFGARKLFDDDQGPKYLNTPETPIYKKAQVLYGLDLAKKSISRDHRVVVVEGYTDVMACHLAGVTTAIATCGTAFGADHMSVVGRVVGSEASGEIVFTFDPDAAGQKAALRAFAEARGSSLGSYVAVGPEGLDPCDLRLERGDAAVRSLIELKSPLFEFVIDRRIAEYDLRSVEGRVAALRSTAPIVADIRDAGIRTRYEHLLSKRLGEDLGEVRRAVSRASARERDRAAEPAASSSPAAPPAETTRVTIASLPRSADTAIERDALMGVLQYGHTLDPAEVDAALAADPVLAPLVTAAPGRRVPRTTDPQELAVRAVLGQQVSTAAARTHAARLVLDRGEPVDDPEGGLTHLFPTPRALLEVDPETLAMPRARRTALLNLVTALADGLDIGPDCDRARARTALLALPGLGPWTVETVAMRAWGDPDAFLPTDLGVRAAATALGLPDRAGELGRRSRRWSPWRAYAVQHLWATGDHPVNTMPT